MKIIYEDDYGNRTYNNTFVAVPGDIVMIDGEDWLVKTRFYDLTNDELLISLTQKSIRERVEESKDSTSGRLREMSRAIVDINKRQDSQDKLTKSLREQTMSIRQHIRSNQPKPKETQ